MPGIELINPEELGPAVGFSHVAVGGELVVLGGQIGCDGTGRILVPGDMAAQFEQAIRNIATALRAAGCRPQDVLKITYYVTDREAYRQVLKEIGASYRSTFGRHYPAASLFEVKGLYDPEAMIEIECLAVRPQVAT